MGIGPKYLEVLFKRFGGFLKLNENRARLNCVDLDSAFVFCGQGLAQPGAIWVEVTWAEVVLWFIQGGNCQFAKTASCSDSSQHLPGFIF